MKYKLNVVALGILCCASVFAQDKQSKLSEKFSVNKDVTVNLNTTHTDIVFETWNKNTVEVQAYLEGDNLTEENGKRILDSWQVDVLGNSREVTINSVAGNPWGGNITASSVRMGERGQELKMLAPMIKDLLGPLMENVANNPMPSALSQNLASINFDYNKYQENEEEYIQQWENQMQEKYGDDFKVAMEDWGKQFEKNVEKIVPQMEIKVEAWGNRVGNDMDAWGQQFGREMQAWAAQFIRDFESQQQRGNVTVYRYNSSTNKKGTSNMTKRIKVKVPKDAKLRLNIRHGDVRLAERSNNVRASLSHTKLEANIIDGDQTFIKASYSPILVRQWNNGRLVINYVKNCRIENAKNLQVNSDSSNIFIQQLDENGAITGSFGAITIANLGESFSTLDLAVVNSDFKLKLPKAAFNFTYSGAQSLISLPKTLKTNARRNFGNVFINGFQDTRNTDKAITINAKYSEIILQ
ncbi:hypothetical protein [Aquimarina sp. MMG016]|uniref:hypothetical protein n=1 Tax=Aquimarina sp. MMG016 TaxID=2822690 RepID=UPI001B39D86D|nr:hypothetical protein [Aquimarina sp. MMG016]MBQ4820338.1 hypothetical protein [Aquimarina sp. MMG016]